MSTPVRQDGFTGGEAAPQFYARTSNPRYGISLRTCKNFFPILHGALLNRPGTKYVARAKNDGKVILRPFVFSDGQTFVLVFGDLYVRFITNGGVVESAPGVPYEVVTPYVVADLARLKFAQSGDVITLTHPSYQPRELARITNTNWTLTNVSFVPQAYFAGTPFFDAKDIGLSSAVKWDSIVAGSVGYAKDAIVIHQPGGGVTPWRLFQSQIAANHSTPGVADWTELTYAAGTTYDKGQYAWGDATAALQGQVYVSLIEQNKGNTPSTTPAAWSIATDAGHPPKAWRWALTIVWRDSKGITRETLASVVQIGPGGGGTTSVVAPDRPAKIQWTAPGATGFSYQVVAYNAYRGIGTLWGLVGSAGAGDTSFVDPGTTPNYAIQPPRGTNPFTIADGAGTANTNKWPGAVTYHELRRVFARTDVKPGRFFGSRQDDYTNFDVNFPVQETDCYEFPIASEQLQEIRSLLSLHKLLLFTGQAVFSAAGQQGQTIKPTSIQVKREVGGRGASYLQPLAIDNVSLFNTAKGNRVRDLSYDFRVDGLNGIDLTEYSRHLFQGRTLVGWCYAEEPFKLIWAARDDGLLLSMTYEHASGTFAWALHKTLGAVEDLCSVPEGTEDAVYLAVARAVGGATVRYLERMASRILPQLADGIDPETGLTKYRDDVRFGIFLDAALSFDGRNTGVTTMQVSGAGYNADDLVTVTASVASFAATDVDDQVVIDPDGVPTRITVTAFTDTTHVTGRLEAPLPIGFQNVPTTNWGWARDTMTGLGHLEGKTVSVLGDGNVHGPFVVIGGAIGPLTPPALIAHAGLPYNSDLELLDIASTAVKPNVKSIVQVIFEVVASYGISAGETFDKLRPAKLKKVSDGFGAPVLVTDQVPVSVDSSWNTGGRAVLRQSDPLPLTVVAAIRDVEVGGRG